jgi:DNA-binding CsgD family transcriptional regulator
VRRYFLYETVLCWRAVEETRVKKPAPTEPLLDLIYRGATNNAALKEALIGLADHFQCRGAALVSFDNRSPATHLMLSTGAWDGDVVRKYHEVAGIDPAPAAFSRLAPGTASTTNRILSRDALRSGEFVNDFYRPSGFQETLGATLFADQSRFALLGLHRGSGDAAFEDWEIAGVQRFTPHLIRAMQLRRAFIEVESKSAELQDCVERLQTGIALLNRNGMAYFVNRAARAIFNGGDGLTLNRAGRPAAAHATTRRKLDDLIAATCLGGSGGVISIPTTDPATAYAALIAPSSSDIRGWFGQSLTEPGAIMLIHDPRSRSSGVTEVLQSALGLRPAAAKLVAALAADDTLQSFAEREGITINTARFHLHAALARTQTRSQMELVRLVVRLLRDLALRDES